MIEINFN